jgi:hypothetical protein
MNEDFEGYWDIKIFFIQERLEFGGLTVEIISF